MKGIAYRKYGSPDVLERAEVEKPVPTDDEVLIKIPAASVHRSDWESLIGSPLYARIGGLRKPGRPVLGSDIAGPVEAVGRNNTQFQPGDEVFGEMAQYRGGFAEYVCNRGAFRAPKPAAIPFEEASAILQFVKVGKSLRVLIDAIR